MADRASDAVAVPIRRPMSVWLYPAGWLLLLVFALMFFSALGTVLLGILAASIIACTLYPLKRHIPGPPAVGVMLLALALVAVVAGIALSLSWPLAQPIADAASNWPRIRTNINATLGTWSTSLGLEEPLRVERLLEGLGDFLAGTGGQQFFSRSADVLLGILISLAFTLVGSVFLLSEPPDRLLDPMVRLLPERHRRPFRAALDDLGHRFRRWVIGTFTGMCVVFTASVVGFRIVGLEMALPLALLAGFAEIVPTVGPATACFFVALFAAATDGATAAFGVLIVYGVIQLLEAYVILPLIMRGAVNIHPAVTLFTVVLWGKVFGVPGLILAIPINLTIWTFLEHFRLRQQDAAPLPSR